MTRRGAVGLSAVAILICYASILVSMFHLWMTDEDMAHGMLVPPVIFWILYRERGRLADLPVRPSWWGWGLLFAGAALQIASARGAGIFVGSVAFLVSAAGAVVSLGGGAWLRALAFPFLLGVFMLPKLSFFYNELTLPLQLLASRMAAGILSVAGFAVIRSGNILNVAGHAVSVVAECNGIRYLLPLCFLALVFAYMTGAAAWVRMAVFAAAVPIAILANALRVAVSAASPALAIGTLHTVTGVVVFVLMLPVLASVQKLFQLLGARRDA